MRNLGRLIAHPSEVLSRRVYVVAWAIAVFIAVAGGVFYLRSETAEAWYLGLIFALPVLWLAAEHLLRENNDMPPSEGPYAAP